MRYLSQNETKKLQGDQNEYLNCRNNPAYLVWKNEMLKGSGQI
jgi:hypothetical protein